MYKHPTEGKNHKSVSYSHYWTHYLLYSMQNTWQALQLKSTPELVDSLSGNWQLKNCVHWILGSRTSSLASLYGPCNTICVDYGTNIVMGRICTERSYGTDHNPDNVNTSETRGSSSTLLKCLLKKQKPQEDEH